MSRLDASERPAACQVGEMSAPGDGAGVALNRRAHAKDGRCSVRRRHCRGRGLRGRGRLGERREAGRQHRLGGSSGAGTGGFTGSRPDGGVTLPPETEVESSYEVPVATGRYIWIANPQSGRVAYVEGATLNVHTVEAGNAPTTIASIPGNGGDAVVVLNVLSNDLTVLRVAADGALAKTTVSGIASGANALTISPGGRWVMAWTDTRRISDSDSLQGHQAVTLVDLTRATPVPTVLSVGFRPVAVAYAADESAAFAVTQDGVSVVTLGGASGPRVTGNVALTDDPTDDADTRDVSITPNGRLALVRRNGNAAIGIADLSTGTLGSIALSGAVTDLDVTADGSQAVAVVRDTSEVAICRWPAASRRRRPFSTCR